MGQIAKDLLLVGSIPMETVEEVLRTCGRAIGYFVPCLPDGEVGDRSWWHNYLAYHFYHSHPAISTVQRPAPVDGVEQWKPKSLTDMWLFKIKPGVKEMTFNDLGYATEAINSYGIFRRLREKGDIPAGVRFQVCLPLTGSALDTFFHDPADAPIVRPAYERAILHEIEKMLEKIPAQDLAIQWDVCVEVLDLEDRLPWTPQDDKYARNTAPIARLSPHIPTEVVLGYHWCYGTLGGWPMVRPQDLTLCVQLSNTAVAQSGRRVDFVHMPAPRHCEEAYFAPLRNLKVGDTRVYLGLVHDTDGIEGFRERLAIAKKYLRGFGVGSVCGYGRRPPEDMPRVLEVHAAAAEELRRQGV